MFLVAGVDIELEVFSGHGSYVAGEETAMLESMQGRPAMPRKNRRFIRPISVCMANRPWSTTSRRCAIFRGFLRKGAAWFGEVGTEKCPGTMMFSLSGAVNRPGVYEMPMGITIRDLIETVRRWVPNGRKIKAVFPGRAGIFNGDGGSAGSSRWILIR